MKVTTVKAKVELCVPDTVPCSLYQFILIAFRKWALRLFTFYRWKNWGTTVGWSVVVKSCRLLQVQAGSVQILILRLIALWSWPNRGSSYLAESSFLVSKIEMMMVVIAVVMMMMVMRWWWWRWYQFSSVTQSCPTLCKPMDCSTLSFPIHHQLLELAQTHVHRVSDDDGT